MKSWAFPVDSEGDGADGGDGGEEGEGEARKEEEGLCVEDRNGVVT